MKRFHRKHDSVIFSSHWDGQMCAIGPNNKNNAVDLVWTAYRTFASFGFRQRLPWFIGLAKCWRHMY